jgi:hypothetical protein
MLATRYGPLVRRAAHNMIKDVIMREMDGKKGQGGERAAPNRVSERLDGIHKEGRKAIRGKCSPGRPSRAKIRQRQK